uniref:WGS project CAEQ00000000 data, annotated contig 243 n=1 Tax=Trypanosoma congolense (strain IL3000) TaxID=1068625 RepID=F9WE25_TRYCI|nr:unnamed protein product [Trypanosoma congolense IL3000]
MGETMGLDASWGVGALLFSGNCGKVRKCRNTSRLSCGYRTESVTMEMGLNTVTTMFRGRPIREQKGSRPHGLDIDVDSPAVRSRRSAERHPPEDMWEAAPPRQTECSNHPAVCVLIPCGGKENDLLNKVAVKGNDFMQVFSAWITDMVSGALRQKRSEEQPVRPRSSGSKEDEAHNDGGGIALTAPGSDIQTSRMISQGAERQQVWQRVSVTPQGRNKRKRPRTV